jgi:hypothetical protein
MAKRAVLAKSLEPKSFTFELFSTIFYSPGCFCNSDDLLSLFSKPYQANRA